MNRKHLLAILTIALATFLFVSVRLDIVSSSYSINTLEKEERSSRNDINVLSARINAAKSPKRLEQIAHKLFGMRAPEPNQKILMDK